MSKPLRTDQGIDEIEKNAQGDTGRENIVAAHHSFSQTKVYRMATAKKPSPVATIMKSDITAPSKPVC
jgi:hypothetical protein